jgi:protein tyrosine/serine phosphatase
MKNRFLKIAGLVLGVLLLSSGTYLGGLQLTGNFHEVISGQLYRSGQLTAPQLATYVGQHGIKTIINLRGHSDSDWYAQEVAEADRLGVGHVDFQMSARKELTPARARELIALLKDVPKPVLIHCQAGADRSGLVSSLYLEQIANASEEVAEQQLSFAFGHIGIRYLSSTIAMDDSWEKLQNSNLGG